MGQVREVFASGEGAKPDLGQLNFATSERDYLNSGPVLNPLVFTRAAKTPVGSTSAGVFFIAGASARVVTWPLKSSKRDNVIHSDKMVPGGG